MGMAVAATMSMAHAGDYTIVRRVEVVGNDLDCNRRKSMVWRNSEERASEALIGRSCD